MNKSLIVSISRKYFGLLLLTASLLLIASSNSNYLATPSSKSGSMITFLTPKRPATITPGAANTNNDVADTTFQSNPVTDNNFAYSDTQNNTPLTPESTPMTQSIVPPAITTPPSETYVPATTTTDPDTSYYPASRCGGCRPGNYKSGPQVTCPQYMACVY